MKKKIVVSLTLLLACSIIFSSYYQGVGIAFGLDCTGAETALNNPMGCDITGGCHAHNPSQTWITVNIELDSAGIPTTHYVGGMAYTVKLLGINTTNDSLPYFGFQITSMVGDTAPANPINAGTWNTPFPFGSHYTQPQPGNFNLGLMEQNPPPPVTTGNGKLGSTYEIQFNWTAPPTGTGTISFWSVINAVNSNIATSGDNYSNSHLTVYEMNPSVGLDTNPSLINGSFEIYPIPAKERFNLKYQLTVPSLVGINIYDTQGILVYPVINKILSPGKQTQFIDITSLKAGTYIVIINIDGKYYSKKLLVE